MFFCGFSEISQNSYFLKHTWTATSDSKHILEKNKNYCWHFLYMPLREKCPNTEFFLVRIQENTDQKKLRIWTLFTQWHIQKHGYMYIFLFHEQISFNLSFCPSLPVNFRRLTIFRCDMVMFLCIISKLQSRCVFKVFKKIVFIFKFTLQVNHPSWITSTTVSKKLYRKFGYLVILLELLRKFSKIFWNGEETPISYIIVFFIFSLFPM